MFVPAAMKRMADSKLASHRKTALSLLENPRTVPLVTPVLYNSPLLKSEGETMSNLENALQELREKRSRAQIEIEKLDQIISGIESLNGTGVLQQPSQPIRIISAASRRKMALAQKARWASVRKQSQPAAAVARATGATPAKRTMSAAARRKIAATQKARWAKIRAAKKAA
jgi:hypothetical protein